MGWRDAALSLKGGELFFFFLKMGHWSTSKNGQKTLNLELKRLNFNSDIQIETIKSFNNKECNLFSETSDDDSSLVSLTGEFEKGFLKKRI